jgi:hypothetical protein
LTEGTVGDPLYWPFTLAIVTALALQAWRRYALSRVRTAPHGPAATA